MQSCIISQRHRWGMGCRSGLTYQGSSFSAWVLGDQHTSRTESVLEALEFLWFIPAAPIVHRSHHSEHSLHKSYWCVSVYDCAMQCSGCDSSLLPLRSFTILQLLWPDLMWSLVTDRALRCSLWQSMRTNTQLCSSQVWRLQRLVRQKEAGRRGRKRWAVWLCGDQESSCKGL